MLYPRVLLLIRSPLTIGPTRVENTPVCIAVLGVEPRVPWLLGWGYFPSLLPSFLPFFDGYGAQSFLGDGRHDRARAQPKDRHLNFFSLKDIYLFICLLCMLCACMAF